MKSFALKTTFITMFFLAAIATAEAQEVVEPDSGAASDSVDVVITPKKGQDSTIVRVGGMRIIVLPDDKRNGETLIIDSEDVDSEDIDMDCDEDVTHWAGIGIGVNGYLHNNGLMMPSSHDFLELDYAKSVSIDLNLLEKDFRLYKQHVELVTGLGLQFVNYAFKSEYATLSNRDPLQASIDSTRALDKNKLKATYVTAPLMLGFSTHKDEDKAFKLAVGAQASWRIGSKLKQQFASEGLTYKPKIKSDFDLNPFLFHAVASIGYGPVNVVASYGLNTLFESGKTIDLVPFDLGLQLMF